jgi:hypothetical protein
MNGNILQDKFVNTIIFQLNLLIKKRLRPPDNKTTI